MMLKFPDRAGRSLAFDLMKTGLYMFEKHTNNWEPVRPLPFDVQANIRISLYKIGITNVCFAYDQALFHFLCEDDMNMAFMHYGVEE